MLPRLEYLAIRTRSFALLDMNTLARRWTNSQEGAAGVRNVHQTLNTIVVWHIDGVGSGTMHTWVQELGSYVGDWTYTAEVRNVES